MHDSRLLQEELGLLDPSLISFRRDDFQDLVLVRPEGEVVGIRLVRALPCSGRQRMVSVRSSEGEEVGIVADLKTLDAGSRRLVEAELERCYFVPRIVRVLAVEERFHVPIWDVETDRGRRHFEIRSGQRDVQVSGGRILIRDADGNHYEIPDYRRLDRQSQTLIESQL